MKKFPVILAIFLLLSAGFWYDHHTLKKQVHILETELKERASNRDILEGCINDSNSKYQIFLDSYVDNIGTELYPHYTVDKETREWLDNRLKSDLEFCQREFGTTI